MVYSRYMLRFDDICPTMNWATWEAIESHLVLFNVKPILAVIPDNRDPKLMVDPPRADFWNRVRRWQEMGWTIALHGYQHVYVNQNAGMLRLTPQSEFAGLSYDEQKAKLEQGLAIFKEQGVRADAWVAPSHSFDRTTVKILAELGISVISDGLWAWPFTSKDHMVWVPQQLWGFRPRGRGIWTICNHHNNWTGRDVDSFGGHLASYASQMTDLATVVSTHADRELTVIDRWTALCELAWNHRIRDWLSYVRWKLIPKRKAAA